MADPTLKNTGITLEAKVADEGKTTSAKTTASKVSGQPTGEQSMPSQVGVQKLRQTKLVLSFLLVFVLPSILGGLYYAVIAADRYATGANFLVRGLDSGGSADIIGSFTGLTSSGSTTSDSYVIRRYLESPDLVRFLDNQLNLQAHYSDNSIDPLSRFDASQPFEEFVVYWQRRVTTTYDSTTGIVTFEVQAFDAETAFALAETVLEEANSLVNTLSEKARQDSVRFAVNEVERAEQRLRKAQLAVRKFRSARGSVDPAMNAQLDAELIASLETQLAGFHARIQALSIEVDPDAPKLRQLNRQASAIKTQIVRRRAAIGDNNLEVEGSSTADILAEFEALQIEQTFAQQRYASALSSLEIARMDADRQQRYLAIFGRPYKPEEAIYPHRLRNTLLTLAAAFALWAIGTLVTYAVRDHLR